ncbi:NAD(P)/FAD-dependent oxidoreductase [Sagittula sp. SSi028]|uniref:NAD(P)/FAD-dependent oxidoreductase n=1 Tax=Sagittula sp. SSi028 TaxID=3400636 RepID=UPI003AF7B6D4
MKQVNETHPFGANPPLWQATAERLSVDAPMLNTCDVAVIGGGYTGLATALFAAEAGLAVQVLEAGQIGSGASGRNVGLVNAGLWLPPREVERRLGPELGPRFVSLFADAPRQVFDLIERYQIRCEARRDGTLHAAHASSGMRDLTARHQAWRKLGAPVELLDAQDMAGATGTTAFAGGLRDMRAGTVNPMGYARGLAWAARTAGAHIAECAPVETLRRDGGGWIVSGPAGDLRATSVVLATNAFSAALRPELARCFAIIRYQQLATEPLGPQVAHVLPRGEGLWDTGLVMRSLRKDHAGRLILGTMGHLAGSADRGASAAWAQRLLRRWFPDLGPQRFEAAWDGQIAMTPDHLPRILQLDNGLYCPIGYNGRGVTTGTVFGRALADVLAGGDPAGLPLPLTAPKPVALAKIRGQVVNLAAAMSLRL